MRYRPKLVNGDFWGIFGFFREFTGILRDFTGFFGNFVGFLDTGCAMLDTRCSSAEGGGREFLVLRVECWVWGWGCRRRRGENSFRSGLVASVVVSLCRTGRSVSSNVVRTAAKNVSPVQTQVSSETMTWASRLFIPRTVNSAFFRQFISAYLL